MRAYLELLKDVLETGVVRGDRTGTGTQSVFGRQLRFDLSEGFPAVTTKKLHFKSVAYELLWFLRGETNVGWLQAHKVRIWNEWADDNGELGPVYGKQWRAWPGPNGPIDQIAQLVDGLKNNPESRRHILSAWNVAQVPEMALPPCHLLAQFYVAGGRLSCQLYQRSGDLFLGVPFNIACYSLLTHMMAQVCGLGVGDFVHTLGDAHIYENHQAQVLEQLKRAPKALPTLRLDPSIHDIDDFEYGHINLEDYDPWPAIKASVAV